MSERERLKDERWELLNSFGRGPFYDGKVRMRIEEIDRRLGTPATSCIAGRGDEDPSWWLTL